MRYIEKLSWILDKPDTGIQDQNETIRENIAFVHSMGLKCDSVGWCDLDLADPGIPEIFEKIAAFCQENGWKARCVYRREYPQTQSDWYTMEYCFFRDNTPADLLETDTPGVFNRGIRAFYENRSGLKRWGMDLFVPERIRKACEKNQLDMDFCWARDVGKYESEQYFHAYGKQLVPEIAVDFGLRESPSRLAAAGGWLPKIAEVFHTLQFITLPDCYLASDLPENGIAYAYVPQTHSCAGRNTILIHKDAAQILLQEKAISASALRPAPVVDSLPGGYIWQQTQPIPRPSAAYMRKMDTDCQKLKAKSRPKRHISEKEAVKLLRSAKKERKADFRKALPKAACQALSGSPYAPLMPYYLVTDGGYLSDEYELLSYDRAVAENTAFYRSLETEELLEKRPQGVVIAKCADGDTVLLCQDGKVLRFSHEAPEVISQWPALAWFISEALQ